MSMMYKILLITLMINIVLYLAGYNTGDRTILTYMVGKESLQQRTLKPGELVQESQETPSIIERVMDTLLGFLAPLKPVLGPIKIIFSVLTSEWGLLSNGDVPFEVALFIALPLTLAKIMVLIMFIRGVVI